MSDSQRYGHVETAEPVGSTSADILLVVVLLAVMCLFLLRNISAFRDGGLRVARPSGSSSSKTKEAKPAFGAAIEEEEDDDDEEEEDDEDEKDK
eukprot:gene21207-28115_t